MSGLQDTVATQTRGTKQIKQGLIFLLSMWQKRRGYNGEQIGEARYLSQPVSSDILSPGKTRLLLLLALYLLHAPLLGGRLKPT